MNGPFKAGHFTNMKIKKDLNMYKSERMLNGSIN